MYIKLPLPTLLFHSLWMGLLMTASAVAAESVPGNAFGDPGYQVKMEKGWIKQAIKHDKKAGKADLVVALGQQTYPALRKFVEDYAERKGLNIVVQRGSCGVSAKKLARKAVEVAAFCCPPGNSDRLPGIEFHTIGIAPIALITNPANELSNVSSEEARDIFGGETIKWSQLPVENKVQLPTKDIQPVARLHCKKRPGHWRNILDSEDMFSPRVRSVGVIPDMIKEVSATPSAIGFETLYMLKVFKDKGEVKVLSIDGRQPSELQHLLAGNYPFYRSFSMTTWQGDEKNIQLSHELVAELKKHIEQQGEDYGMISSARLRQAGWKFRNNELVAEPDGDRVFSERQ